MEIKILKGARPCFLVALFALTAWTEQALTATASDVGVTTPGTATTTDTPMAPTPETALRARVLGRWQALMKRDYDTAYERYVSPTYRAAFSQRHFYHMYGGQIVRDKVEVRRIDFTDAEKSEARVLVTIYFTTDIQGRAQQLTGENKEYWSKIDGQWYLVPVTARGGGGL
jgi:hypothetical protein